MYDPQATRCRLTRTLPAAASACEPAAWSNVLLSVTFGMTLEPLYEERRSRHCRCLACRVAPLTERRLDRDSSRPATWALSRHDATRRRRPGTPSSALNMHYPEPTQRRPQWRRVVGCSGWLVSSRFEPLPCSIDGGCQQFNFGLPRLALFLRDRRRAGPATRDPRVDSRPSSLECDWIATALVL